MFTIEKEDGREAPCKTQYFLISISLRPDDVNLRYFKLKSFGLTVLMI